MSDPFLNQVALDISPRGLGTSADYTNLSVNPTVSETHLLTNNTTSTVFQNDTAFIGGLVGTSSDGNTYLINSSISGNSMDNLTIEMWGLSLNAYFIELMDSAYYANQSDNTLPHISVAMSLEFQEVSGGTPYYRHRITLSVGDWYDSFLLFGGAIADTTADKVGFYIVVDQVTQSVSFRTASNNPLDNIYTLTKPLAGLPHPFTNPLYAVRLGKGMDSTCQVGHTRVTIGNRGALTDRLLWGTGTIIDEVVTESFNNTSSYTESPVNKIDEYIVVTEEYKESPVNRIDENIVVTEEYKEGATYHAKELFIDFQSSTQVGKTAFVTDTSVDFQSSTQVGKTAFVTDTSANFNSYEGTLNQYDVPVTLQTFLATFSDVYTFIPILYNITVTSLPVVFTTYTVSHNIYTNTTVYETVIESLLNIANLSTKSDESVSDIITITLDSLDSSSAVINETFTLYGTSDSSVYLESSILDEFISSSSSLAASQISEGFTDSLLVQDNTGVFTPELVINEVIGISETLFDYTNLSGLHEDIIESIITTSSISQTINSYNTIVDLVKILDKGVVQYLEEISDLLNYSAISIDTQISLELLFDKFNIFHSLYDSLSLTTSIDEILSILEDYKVGYTHTLEDGIIYSDILENVLYVIEESSDNIDIDISIDAYSAILLKLSSSIEVDDNIDSTSLFNYLINETFRMVGIGVKKGTITSSYTYQPETASVTTYSNYNFTSSTRFHKEYLFSNENGLYLYGADTDDGVPITSTLTTPAYDFGTSNLKSVSQAYLGLSTDGVVLLKVRVDGKAEVTYKLNKRTTDLQTLQIDIGKGLLGRYFQFEIITQADTFDLESIEFLPLDVGRKR